MEENLASFDDNDVVELSTPDTNSAQTEGGEGLDTFDNPVTMKEEETEEKVEKEIDPDSQVNLLKDQEDKDVESKSDKKNEKEEADKEGDDGKSSGKEEGKEEKKEESGEESSEAKKVKEIKGKLGEDEFGIPAEAEVEVRIKGKKESVTVQELMNNYSGKQNYDQKFSELGEQKKEIEQKSQQLESEVSVLQNHLQKIVGILDDKEANPMDALEYLLDTTGRNTVSFKKKVLETQLDELEALQDMDEVERELYWKNKELDYLKRQSESSEKQSRQEADEISFRDQVNEMREAQGVSEDDFVDAFKELESLGYEGLNPAQVVDFASLRPHLDEAENLVNVYSESIDPEQINSITSEIAVSLRKGEVTKKEIKAILEEEYGDTKELESLTKRAAKRAKEVENTSNLKYKAREESHVESFDDYDEQYVS